MPKLMSHHRALIYSLSFAGGLIVLLTLRDLGLAWYAYWILAGVTYAFLVTELLSTYRFAKQVEDHIDLPHIPDNTLRPNFYYHAILPTLLFISMAIYIFLDFTIIIDLVLIVLISITYYAILRHLRATYENDFKTEAWSHHVLDAATIIVYFSVSTAAAELAMRYDWSILSVVTVVSLALASFLGLTLWKRLEVSAKAVFVSLILMVVMGIFSYIIWMLLHSTLEPLRIGALWALLYYLFSAIFIHNLEGTFRFGVFLEYLLIAVVALFLLAQ